MEVGRTSVPPQRTGALGRYLKEKTQGSWGGGGWV